jgi:hypothetical protein
VVRSLQPNQGGTKNGGGEQDSEAPCSPPGSPCGRSRRQRGSPDESVGHRRRSGRREESPAAVLLGDDDDDDALAHLAAPGLAADEVKGTRARQRHGDASGTAGGSLVCGERASRAAAVVVVACHLQHRVGAVVVFEHCGSEGKKQSVLSIRKQGKTKQNHGKIAMSVDRFENRDYDCGEENSRTEVVADLEAVDGGPVVQPVGLYRHLPPVIMATDHDVVGRLRARHCDQEHRSAEESRP